MRYWYSTGTELSSGTEVSLYQRQEIISAAAHVVCRQSSEWAGCCLALFTRLLHLPPASSSLLSSYSCCRRTVGFYLVSFSHWSGWGFPWFIYFFTNSIYIIRSLSLFFPQYVFQIHMLQCLVILPPALTWLTFRLMSRTRSFMRSCWQLWKRHVGLLWSEKATKGNRC